MICNKNKECNADCLDKESHPFMHYCLMACDRKGGIAGAVCEPIPLTGAQLIADERRRQIEIEGWTSEHDLEHAPFSMAIAGACYVLDFKEDTHICTNQYNEKVILNDVINVLWPFDGIYWKPTINDPIKQLTKAGALIAAEIDRIQMVNKNNA